MRWQRGALENLRHYGLTRTTLRYWGQQVGIGLGVLAFQAYLALTVWVLVAGPEFQASWFWSGIGLVFLAERLVTVRRGGWRAQLLALRLAVLLCHARRDPDTRAFKLSRHGPQQFDLRVGTDWAERYPQSAHLLQEEVLAWQKANVQLSLHVG